MELMTAAQPQTPLAGLLRLLSDGGLHSLAELARRLGLSEPLVAAMVADLSRRGYLAAVGDECGAACAGCGIQAACVAPGAGMHALHQPNAAPPPRLLALTSKGQRAARRA
jgi:hypothetical protein